MNDKDTILKTMIAHPDRSQEIFYTPKTLKEYLFLLRNTDQVEFIIKEIINDKPELIKVVEIIGVPFAIRPTGLIESFLANGGFTKIDEDLEIERTKQEKRLSKSDELLDLDLKLKTFESKIKNRIIIAGFIITILSFLITILTLKFW